MRNILAVALVLASIPANAKEYDYSGYMQVVDGDTLKTSHSKIRLVGIDTPELKQSCNNGKVKCGVLAKQALENLIGDKQVDCNKIGTDLYGRILGECFVEEVNINRWMLQNGWAVYYSSRGIDKVAYKIDQTTAKVARKGIWNMQFINPKTYRKNKKGYKNENK